MNYPKSLFKYSKFKNYSLDMIEKGYIYFCPANKLDDHFECLCDFSKYQDLSMEVFFDVVKEILNDLGIRVPDIPLNELYDSYSLNENKAINFIKENNSNVSNDKIKLLIDTIKSLENKKIPTEFEDNIKQVVLMQDYVGICSFAEENTNQVLWTMYANNYNGYCIEYDIEKAVLEDSNVKNNLMKVKYTDIKAVDLIRELLKIVFTNVLQKARLNMKSYNEDTLKNIIIDIGTTKYIDWSFQKEWRLIGEPNDKNLILPIKAVYLGKNLSKTNKSKIVSKCKKKDIPVYTQTNDYVSLKIKFNIMGGLANVTRREGSLRDR